MMTRFAGLKEDLKPPPAKVIDLVPPSDPPAAATKRPGARDGKKGVLGHFSPELSRTLNMMAIEEGRTVQALMGEAFDLLLRARGKHPFGER